MRLKSVDIKGCLIVVFFADSAVVMFALRAVCFNLGVDRFPSTKKSSFLGAKY